MVATTGMYSYWREWKQGEVKWLKVRFTYVRLPCRREEVLKTCCLPDIQKAQWLYSSSQMLYVHWQTSFARLKEKQLRNSMIFDEEAKQRVSRLFSGICEQFVIAPMSFYSVAKFLQPPWAFLLQINTDRYYSSANWWGSEQSNLSQTPLYRENEPMWWQSISVFSGSLEYLALPDSFRQNFILETIRLRTMTVKIFMFDQKEFWWLVFLMFFSGLKYLSIKLWRNGVGKCFKSLGSMLQDSKPFIIFVPVLDRLRRDISILN